MKEIPLTQGQFAIVDDADYAWLNQWKWCAHKIRDYFYAVRHSSRKKGKRYTLLMHRVILGLERGDKRQGDHRNRNTLDNSQDNLRICTPRQNAMNRKAFSNTTSKYKGVSWNRQAKKWQAQIKIKGESRYLGSFDLEIDAAIAYNEEAKKHYGEFAYLNVIV